MENTSPVSPAMKELLEKAQSCSGHNSKGTSYASPSYVDYYNRLLTTDDIPIETYGIEANNRKDSVSLPWDDSIKNMILDLSSFSGSEKYSTCIVLSQPGFKYCDALISLLLLKYCKYGSTLVLVSLSDEYQESFSVHITYNSVRSENCVDEHMFVYRSDLVASIVSWYCPYRTCILCHDNSISEYVNCIKMMPTSIWSIQCTYSSYISVKGGGTCKYICPIYGYQWSPETRAIGKGDIIINTLGAPSTYKGKLNYYNRCIRGSMQPTGKCFDCEMLFRSVAFAYDVPIQDSVKKANIRFSDTFLSLTRFGST